MSAPKVKARCGRRPVFGLSDIALAMELKEAGLSYAQIAAKWDGGVRMSVATAYYLCNTRTAGRRLQRVGQDVRRRVLELREQGRLYREIVATIKAEFGVALSISGACRICNSRRAKRP
jgi:intein-encoded DNA endonuclease-like protein